MKPPVENRLRANLLLLNHGEGQHPIIRDFTIPLLREAADEIERLRETESNMVDVAMQKDMEIAELREALAQIRDHQPPYESPTESELNEMENCKRCEVCRERAWPPSGLCDEHYRLPARYRDRNTAAANTQYIVMKAIARSALGEVPSASGDEGESE